MPRIKNVFCSICQRRMYNRSRDIKTFFCEGAETHHLQKVLVGYEVKQETIYFKKYTVFYEFYKGRIIKMYISDKTDREFSVDKFFYPSTESDIDNYLFL